MLILTRRAHESIIMGKEGEIEIKVLGIRGSQVRLGIEAPQEMPVHREEIYLKIQDEKESGND